MWKIFKRYGCEPTPIYKPSRLRRRERNVKARAAIDIGNKPEEMVNVHETNPLPVEETKPAENTEKKINSIRLNKNICLKEVIIKKEMYIQSYILPKR